MKKLIVLMLLSTVAFASETPFSSKSTIVVTHKDGKQVAYDPEEYVVVKKKPKQKPKAKVEVVPIVVVKETRVIEEKRVEVERAQLKNRVRLLGGYGLTSHDIYLRPYSAELSTKRGIVMGIGYDRMLTRRMSVGAQVLTNETYLLDLGLDF